MHAALAIHLAAQCFSLVALLQRTSPNADVYGNTTDTLDFGGWAL